MPAGFKQEPREETGANIIYRAKTKEGYQFTFVIIRNESYDRFSKLPDTYDKALVKSVPELSTGVESDVQPKRVSAGVMNANVFRYYERETYRGVLFTYHMVAMDKGRKLVLRFSGKYGGFHDQEENISMPEHWLESLMTLGHEYDVPESNEIESGESASQEST